METKKFHIPSSTKSNSLTIFAAKSAFNQFYKKFKMILFFKKGKVHYGVHCSLELNAIDTAKLSWLFSDAEVLTSKTVTGKFVGPRKEMITPWSTNAVEITQNMGLNGILRIEEFVQVDAEHPQFDPMLQSSYENLDQDDHCREKEN